MDRLTERVELARRAITLLEELASKGSLTPIERDAAIQRFEYTFEAVWKAAQLYLREGEGTESGSPKAVVRACFQVGILTAEETTEALAMTDDRNLSVHTYNESLAQTLSSHLPKHAALLRAWLERLAQRTTSGAT